MVGAPSFSQPFLCIQPLIQSPTKICSSIHTPSRYFCMQPSQQSTPKIFSLHQPFNQFKLHQGTKELWSLVRNDTVLITPFFLKVWTVRTGLYVIIKSCTHFRVNLHSTVAWMSRKSLLKRSQYLNFKWQQRDSNAQLLRLYPWI